MRVVFGKRKNPFPNLAGYRQENQSLFDKPLADINPV
jgi:hypothetical protein